MSKLLQSIFQQARFEITVAQLDKLPPRSLPEVAFIGRSNAGKSSAINLITQQKRLAFASKTPGRTQHLNFFEVPPLGKEPQPPYGFLVDLPGYGFASSAKWVKDDWDALIGGYLQQRQNLAGVVMLMDIRHPFTPLDITLLDWLDNIHSSEKPLLILLTKCDKLTSQQKIKTLKEAHQQMKLYPHIRWYDIQLFSATKRVGLSETLNWLAGRLNITPPTTAVS
jgi:GTP-binding protein